jgi:Ca2+-binding EF-hand superfamily protein
MSIGSLGSAMGLGQDLMSLLSRINSTGATGAASAPADEFGGCSNTSAPPASGANNTTGTSKAQLSGEILALLVKLQQQTSSGTAGANASTSISALSASTSIATSSDPLSQLIAAMDTDGDGKISQTEMESYVENNLGGTAAQADALFSGLNNGGTGNLTATQLQNDLQQAAGGVHGHHRHHHHGGGAPSADQVGNDLVKAMDSDGNGSVSQSEFDTFVTGLGGTTSEADADFASLDPGNTGSVDATAFTNAVTALQSSAGQSPVLNLLDAFRSSATTAAGSAVSVTA